MNRAANYEIVKSDEHSIVLRDVGPHDLFKTVTNAADDVVRELVEGGLLKHGMHLFYYDSEGEFGELLLKDTTPDGTYLRMAGFAPAVEQ